MDWSPFLKSLEDSGLATSLRGSLYYFPLLESVHVMALSVLFGTILVVDLRALGIASTGRSFTRMSSELLPITWSAFAVSALTGSLMFITNARVYAHNTSFLIKMLLLALAGLNMAVFHLKDRAPSVPGIGRVTAALSLALWVAIIVAGRVIGFTTTGAQAKQAAPPTMNFDDFLSGGPGGTAGKPALSDLSIKTIMDSMVDPSADFLFDSIADISDEHGVTHKAPTTPADWANERDHLQILVDAEQLLIVPGRRAANPGDRSRDPHVENEPEQVQALVDARHSDFVVRAQRLRQAAESGLTATAAQDKAALLLAITAIDKACESCHLHYFYPNDRRAHQAAKEEGGIIE